MKIFIIITLVVNLLLGSRFTKEGEIITDKITGIQWQDSKKFILTKSLEEVKKKCKELKLGGFDDWRVPNKEEILSVVNYSKKIDPDIDIDKIDLDNKETNSYEWSVEERSYMTHFAWFVYFKYGYSDLYYKYYSNFIRCVRGGEKIEKKKKTIYDKYRYKYRRK